MKGFYHNCDKFKEIDLELMGHYETIGWKPEHFKDFWQVILIFIIGIGVGFLFNWRLFL